MSLFALSVAGVAESLTNLAINSIVCKSGPHASQKVGVSFRLLVGTVAVMAAVGDLKTLRHQTL